MEEYLKTLLEQIRCKKAQPYIRQELQDHMEDQIVANMQAGMDRGLAEKEAVRDMGDPVEAGISLDRIHRPQIAWKLLFLIALISAAGILTHTVIMGQNGGIDGSASGQYLIHVVIGMVVMMVLYFVDYTVLAGFAKWIAILLNIICLLVLLWGSTANGMRRPGFIQAFMLFYVPLYGGIIYQYRGQRYAGVLKSIGWMVVPVFLVLRLPSVMTAGLMLICMLVLLTIALLKGWFMVSKTKAIVGLWGAFSILPGVLFFVFYFGYRFTSYQMARIHAFLANSGEENYLTATVRSVLASSQWIGSNDMDVTDLLPGFNADYILTYVSSMYGMLAAILFCCILALLIFAVFFMAGKQKNQLGMMMGCGCGMVFLVSVLINVLINLGALPPTTTFLPFLSAGGSHIVVSYGLMGIVLSIYRYKSVYPQHVKVRV